MTFKGSPNHSSRHLSTQEEWASSASPQVHFHPSSVFSQPLKGVYIVSELTSDKEAITQAIQDCETAPCNFTVTASVFLM